MTDPTELVGLSLKHRDIMLAAKAANSEGVISFSANGVFIARRVLSDLDIPVQYAVISSNVYTRLIGASWFQRLCEPVPDISLIQTGMMASMLGMDILCDAYSHPEDKIFDVSDGQVFSVVSVTKARGTKVYRTKFSEIED